MQGESWNPSNVEWQQAVTEDRSRFVIALTFGRALNLSNKSSFILGSRQELTRGDPTYYLLLDFPLYQGYSNNGQDGLPFSPTTGGHSGTNFSYDDFHHGFLSHPDYNPNMQNTSPFLPNAETNLYPQFLYPTPASDPTTTSYITTASNSTSTPYHTTPSYPTTQCHTTSHQYSGIRNVDSNPMINQGILLNPSNMYGTNPQMEFPSQQSSFSVIGNTQPPSGDHQDGQGSQSEYKNFPYQCGSCTVGFWRKQNFNDHQVGGHTCFL